MIDPHPLRWGLAVLAAMIAAPCMAATQQPPAQAAPSINLIRDGACQGASTLSGSGLDGVGPGDVAWLPWTVGDGPFRLHATIVLERFATEGAGLAIAGGILGLDDPEHDVVPRGGRFGPPAPLAELRAVPARPGVPIQFVAQWDGKKLRLSTDGVEVGSIALDAAHGRIGIAGPSAAIRVIECTIDGPVHRVPVPTIVFSAADGPIDEHRDPVAAAGPDSIEIVALAVTTRDDGTLDHAIRRRSLRSGTLGPAMPIDVGGIEPGRATIGHDGSGWVLLVQPMSKDLLATSVEVFTSRDTIAWQHAGTIDAGAAPVRLMAVGMRKHGANALEAAATRVVDGSPRACVVRGSGASWSIHDLTTTPSCDPVWAGVDQASIRVPRLPQRWVTPGDRAVPCPSTAQPFWVGASGGSYVTAQGPRNDRLVVASAGDGSIDWVAWDGPVGSVCGASLGNRTWAVFEGGVRAPREHVLLMQLPN